MIVQSVYFCHEDVCIGVGCSALCCRARGAQMVSHGHVQVQYAPTRGARVRERSGTVGGAYSGSGGWMLARGCSLGSMCVNTQRLPTKWGVRCKERQESLGESWLWPRSVRVRREAIPGPELCASSNLSPTARPDCCDYMSIDPSSRGSSHKSSGRSRRASDNSPRRAARKQWRSERHSPARAEREADTLLCSI